MTTSSASEGRSDNSRTAPHLHIRERQISASIAVATITAVTMIVAFGSLPFKMYLSSGAAHASDAVVNIAPQAWGFFTKDPREPVHEGYVLKDGKWLSAARGPNAALSSWLGWDRSSRLSEYDIQLVGVSDVDWNECSAQLGATACIEEAVASADTVPEVTVYADGAKLCGRVAIIRRELVPMAYATLGYTPSLSTFIAEVECEMVVAP